MRNRRSKLLQQSCAIFSISCFLGSAVLEFVPIQLCDGCGHPCARGWCTGIFCGTDSDPQIHRCQNSELMNGEITCEDTDDLNDTNAEVPPKTPRRYRRQCEFPGCDQPSVMVCIFCNIAVCQRHLFHWCTGYPPRAGVGTSGEQVQDQGECQQCPYNRFMHVITCGKTSKISEPLPPWRNTRTPLPSVSKRAALKPKTKQRRRRTKGGADGGDDPDEEEDEQENNEDAIVRNDLG